MNFNLHSGTPLTRLAALQKAIGETDFAVLPAYCNNHVHTIYSFSPYSPTEAVFMAKKAGLMTVGIMDHDSVGGAREFLAAGKVAGLGVTVGAELRTDYSNTSVVGKHLNNPDQPSVGYMALHGIPESQIEAAAEFFVPITKARGIRNRKMTENINKLTEKFGIVLDYERDVQGISMHAEGGSVTERHLTCALANAVARKFGQGDGAIKFIDDMQLPLTDSQRESLKMPTDDYIYRLIGVFKTDLLRRVYVPATDELVDIREVVQFCENHGIILAYPYLGDVGESVTGDKKTQKFEDEYLDELFSLLDDLGIKAVTYMPARNTPEQISRVQALCREHGFFEISGEDINMPSQSFICKQLEKPEFAHLVDSTYALIGHETLANADIENSIVRAPGEIKDKVEKYAAMGRGLVKL